MNITRDIALLQREHSMALRGDQTLLKGIAFTQLTKMHHMEHLLNRTIPKSISQNTVLTLFLL